MKNIYFDEKYSLKRLFSRTKHKSKKRVRALKPTSTLLSQPLFSKWQKFYQDNKALVTPTIYTDNYLCKAITDPFVGNRMSSESSAATPWKIETRYPLSDVRLIEFFIGIPLTQKANYGMSRYLFRRMMKGIIPEGIRLESKSHTAVVPYAYSHRAKDYDYFSEFLEQGITSGKYDFLNLALVQRMWGDLEQLTNQGQKIKKISRPGKVFMAFQLMKLIEKNPTLASDITNRLWER